MHGSVSHLQNLHLDILEPPRPPKSHVSVDAHAHHVLTITNGAQARDSVVMPKEGVALLHLEHVPHLDLAWAKETLRQQRRRGLTYRML